MPPIGKADHDIVYVEYDIKAKRIQEAMRKIYIYKQADMDGLRDHLALYRRDVHVGVPLDLSTPTGISCIGTYIYVW